MLEHGAVDELATGCWRREGEAVILEPTEMKVSQGGNEFKSLNLRLDPAGELSRTFDAEHVGNTSAPDQSR